MRIIIVAIFLVLTFLCSCSDLNNAIKLKPDDSVKLKPDDAIAHSNRGVAYATAASISVPLKNITRPYVCNRI